MCNIAGIDIASMKFDYRIINGNGASLSKGSCEMSYEGFQSFLSDVPEDTVFIMESTGRYHKNLCHFLTGKGFSVCVENPMMIKNYVKSTTLRKTKTDSADALSIARYGLANYDRLHREKHVMDDEDEKFDIVFHDGNDQVHTVTLHHESWFKLGDIIVMAPQDPVKEGYKFGGWYTDPSYAEGTEFDPRDPVEDDMDMYALWIADPSGDDDDTVITVPGTNTAHVVTFDTVFGLEYDVVSSSATSVTFTVSVVGGFELKDGTLKVDSNGGTITESNGTYTLSNIDRNIIVTITGEVSSILDPGGLDEPDEPKEPADDGGFPLWILVVVVVIIVAIVAIVWYMRGRI